MLRCHIVILCNKCPPKVLLLHIATILLYLNLKICKFVKIKFLGFYSNVTILIIVDLFVICLEVDRWCKPNPGGGLKICQVSDKKTAFELVPATVKVLLYFTLKKIVWNKFAVVDRANCIPAL